MNYYRRFLPNLSTIVLPMNKLLLGETVWKWTNACEKAFSFDDYNPELPVKLACDASPYGLGDVLYHTMPYGSERPIVLL